jgi:hypothetical protein
MIYEANTKSRERIIKVGEGGGKNEKKKHKKTGGYVGGSPKLGPFGFNAQLWRRKVLSGEGGCIYLSI